ncbi:hypothetical protein KKC91_05210 [bacterium]|nr:hypothetical protein [bacterium]
MNGNKDQGKHQKIINSASMRIESSRTQEIISGSVDDVLTDVEKNSTLQTDGSIKDETIIHNSICSCGCMGKKENIGARCDICGKTPCINHSFRCARCGKSLCIRCAKTKRNNKFCFWCWLLLTIVIRHRIKAYEIRKD